MKLLVHVFCHRWLLLRGLSCCRHRGMKRRIKAPVPCFVSFCINTARGREHCWMIRDLPECIRYRLRSFWTSMGKGTKNKRRAARGRFPPPSFSWTAALRTRVRSPSNPSSASSCSQPNKSMVHEHFSGCANARSWWKHRTRGEHVRVKGSVALTIQPLIFATMILVFLIKTLSKGHQIERFCLW